MKWVDGVDSTVDGMKFFTQVFVKCRSKDLAQAKTQVRITQQAHGVRQAGFEQQSAGLAGTAELVLANRLLNILAGVVDMQANRGPDGFREVFFS